MLAGTAGKTELLEMIHQGYPVHSDRIFRFVIATASFLN
jgi:hypothetical protein